MKRSSIILGGGMTGLAAGMASGLPVYECAQEPGGICSSYYIRPGQTERLATAPADGEAYRFEIGGGHWIFGGDSIVLRLIERLVPLKRHSRISSVYFRQDDLYVPYPLQNNLRFMPQEFAATALTELAQEPGPFQSMKDWQLEYFGPSLCEKFFFPFHELYTGKLFDRIAPQDPYKSPIDLETAIRGAFKSAPAVGYNTTYAYPIEGLNTLSQRMAERCDVRFGKRVIQIDAKDRVVYFEDGTNQPYELLLSTLPLTKMMGMTGTSVDAPEDPYSSVLVLNIGANKGPQCPRDHWLYNPDARSGFHRVGLYSNVDRAFIPDAARASEECVSLYIERAYPGGEKPDDRAVADYSDSVVAELQSWGFIGDVEVVDPTWIDVAYTWSWPGSNWKSEALHTLEENGILMAGRYSRWIFQGIADSIRDGLFAGASLR